MAQALPQYQSGAPAVLNDSTTLDLTQAQGAFAQLSSQKLSNVYGCPIAIKEIRFFAQTYPIAGPLVTNKQFSAYDFGSILTAFVNANNVNLMQNPVHLRSLGTLLQSNLTWVQQHQTLHGTLGYYYSSTFYRWIFARPLFLPRQGSLDIKIAADPIALRPFDIGVIAPTVKIDVAAVGTLQPDLQGMMAPYPYVAEFAPPGMSTAGGGVPAFAMGNDPIFRNVFANPLLLSRLTASLYNSVGPIGHSNSGTDQLSLNPDDIVARIWDSHGNNISGYGGGVESPLGALVNPQDGNWYIERQLNQYEWLNVELYAKTGITTWFPRVAFHGEHMQLFAP